MGSSGLGRHQVGEDTGEREGLDSGCWICEFGWLNVEFDELKEIRSEPCLLSESAKLLLDLLASQFMMIATQFAFQLNVWERCRFPKITSFMGIYLPVR